MHRDRLGEIIYVGKAINLRNRVRSYFRLTSQADAKVRAMVSNIAEFEYIQCATEMEALILECNLIKKHMPKYNILLKDDKTYPYIEVTLAEDYPRVIRTRRIARDGNRYFGPYTDTGAVRSMLTLIDEMYPLKKCATQKFRDNVRPCLNYHIGKCKGICTGLVNRAEYREMTDEIVDILSGKDAAIIKRLEAKMFEASDNLNFEEAAKYRDYIASLRQLGETQRATMVKGGDVDILIPVVTSLNEIVLQYKVREGKLVGREVIYMRDDVMLSGEERSELLGAFIKQYYSMSTQLPREIILDRHIEDEELLMEFLDKINADNAEARSDVMHKTRLIVPERGDKKALLKMALDDSIQLSKSLDERAEREKERKQALRDSIAGLIRRCAEISGTEPCLIEDGDDREYRVEAYDISNMNGLDNVAAMVVYEGRNPVRNDYRKFKIKNAAGGDDYGSLQEVIYRRLKRLKAGDEGFNKYPDILFIDGGLGQVHAVQQIVDAFRMSIPVVGLAKDDAHRTRAIVFNDGSEIELKNDKMLFSYAGNIQEEVHRFAITFMRGTKGKKMIHSVLEDIPGVGPKRRGELLAHFGGIEAIRNANYEDLMQVEGMNAKVAESVIEFFSKRGESN